MTPTLQMKAFEWRQEYETGLPEIDRQHRQLTRLINELSAAIHNGKDQEALRTILDRLTSYTVTHFQTEENVMMREQWPGLQDHQRKHRRLLSEISNFQNNFQSGNIALTAATADFLRRWLHNHILEDDMVFANEVRR